MCKNSEIEEVKALVSLKPVNVNLPDTQNYGWTALHWAALFGNVKIVKFLLLIGAEIGSKSKKGSTALHLAAQNCHLETVKLLIQFGADL